MSSHQVVRNTDQEPHLDSSGAGLPLPELLIAKYILFPLRCWRVSSEQGLAEFEQTTKQIEAVVADLSEEALAERHLIPRLRGLEDSSRYWSVAMTLEHLIIVGNAMRLAISLLSRGTSSSRNISTADVKPSAAVDPASIRQQFHDVMVDFVGSVGQLQVGRFPNATAVHPWFGPLNATQWVVLAGVHQQIHKRQILEIARRL